MDSLLPPRIRWKIGRRGGCPEISKIQFEFLACKGSLEAFFSNTFFVDQTPQAISRLFARDLVWNDPWINSPCARLLQGTQNPTLPLRPNQSHSQKNGSIFVSQGAHTSFAAGFAEENHRNITEKVASVLGAQKNPRGFSGC